MPLEEGIKNIVLSLFDNSVKIRAEQKPRKSIF